MSRDPAAAEEAFENSYALDPAQPGIDYLMAISRLTQEREEEALALLRKVPVDDPFAEEARVLLARLE